MSSKSQSQSHSPSPMSQKLSQQKQLSKKKSITSKRSQESVSNNHSSNSSGRSSSSLSSSIKQQQVMQQAIQKASCLIELLTRENSQFRQLIGDLQNQLTEERQSHSKLKQSYSNLLIQTTTINQLKTKLQLLSQQNTTLTKHNQSLLIDLEKNRIINKDHLSTFQALTESKQKNKHLHIKIAHLTKSTAQLTASLNALKIQHMSLQNQNQYLLKQLQRYTQKENVYNANISKKETQFHTKLQTLDKTKDAFARRTHQLQQQNLSLITEIQSLKKDKIDLKIITEQTMHTLDLLSNKIQTYKLMENKIHQIYQKVQLQQKTTLSEKYSRSVIPYQQKDDISTSQKLYQIEQVLNYRLQHVQSMLQQIMTQVGEKGWRSSLNHLKETHMTVKRLNDYLDQLSTCPLIISDKHSLF